MSTITCGRCHGSHGSVEEVRGCYTATPVEPVIEIEPVVEPGIYVTPEGKKYRVVRSKSGNLYAEDIQVKRWFHRKWHQARRWTYVPGAINELSADMLRPGANYATGRLPS